MQMQKSIDIPVAFVHDYLLNMGGAERTLAAMKSLCEVSPVYTLLYDEHAVGEVFPRESVISSFLQKLPEFLRKRPRYLALLLPTAVESFDLRDFPVVISSSSAFAKGVVTRARTTHICYCHSPMRYAWDFAHEYQTDTTEKENMRLAVRMLQHYLRIWDRASADRVHAYIANSHAVARRIKKYYGRDATVIYPPVDTDMYRATDADDGYFLIVSRLSPYKRIDLAVRAFNKLQLPLVIAGSGPERKNLEALVESKAISFLGAVSEEKKRDLMECCTALIFPGEDDFGIVPVEAMAARKPVLAYRAGGVTETVIEGVSGEFFDDAMPEALADGVRRLRSNLRAYDRTYIRKHAEQFGIERFKKEFAVAVQNAYTARYD